MRRPLGKYQDYSRNQNGLNKHTGNWIYLIALLHPTHTPLHLEQYINGSMLVIGTLIGAWQGYWIAFVRIPPFITTLSGMLVFRGLSNVGKQEPQSAPTEGRKEFPYTWTACRQMPGSRPKKMNMGVAVIAMLVIGTLIGAWQGYWIAFVRIPPW